MGIWPCPLARSSCAKLCQALCCAEPMSRHTIRNVISLSLGLAGEGGAAKEESGGRGEGTREVNSTSEPGVDQHSAHRELPKVLSLEMFIISSAPECCTLSVIFTHPICVPTAEPAPDGLSSSTGSSE